MGETPSNDTLGRLSDAVRWVGTWAGSLSRGALAQVWVPVPNEETGRCDDMSTTGKPWLVYAHKAEDKEQLSKFRSASLEVTLTNRGNGTANETVQDAMQQQQVIVCEDVCGLPGRIFGRGGKAVECGVRGSMLVPVYAHADMATATPVAVMEIIFLESKPLYHWKMLIVMPNWKLPLLDLYTSVDISYWYDADGAKLLGEPPEVQSPAQAQPHTATQPESPAQTTARALPAPATAVAAPAPRAIDRARGRRGSKPLAAPERKRTASAVSGGSGRFTRAQKSAVVAAQKPLSSSGNAAATVPCDLPALENPSEQRAPAHGPLATAEVQPTAGVSGRTGRLTRAQRSAAAAAQKEPGSTGNPPATVPCELPGPEGPAEQQVLIFDPLAAAKVQATAPAMAGKSGRLTRAQKSAAVAAQKPSSSNGNTAATLPSELPASEEPAEQQVLAAAVRLVARQKRPRVGAAEDRQGGKEGAHPRRSGQLVSHAADNKIEDGTGALSGAAGKRPRVHGINASGRIPQFFMSQAENRAPAVEVEPIQGEGQHRRSRPLADNSTGKSNNTRNEVAHLSFGKAKQHFGLPLSEAAAKLGVHRAHLVRCCKENNMDGWPRLTISMTDPNNAPASGLPSDVPASEIGGFLPCPCARPQRAVPKVAKKRWAAAPRTSTQDNLLHD